MARIGILGGSFNPPHLGHLALARTVLDGGYVDRVCLIPARVPPHKAIPSEADAETRLWMTTLLAEEDSRLLVDDLELTRPGPSFSIDTVTQLASASPHNSYRLIIGSDLAKSFAMWRDYGRLLCLAPPLVAERPDDPFTGGDDYPGMTPEQVAVIAGGRFPMSPVDVSSTMIRSLLAAGAGDDALRRLLTRRVLAFIRQRGLYSVHGTGSSR